MSFNKNESISMRNFIEIGATVYRETVKNRVTFKFKYKFGFIYFFI